MVRKPLTLVALTASTLNVITPAAAQAPGTFEQVGNTLVSAMMLLVGNDEKVYIIDKAENNPTQIGGHPAWGSVWDIKTRTVTPMDMPTNPFCAAGMHMPNGSFAVFGGNAPVGPGGVNTPKVNGQTVQDPTYKDLDGRKGIRIINPCTGPNEQFASDCQWYEDPATLSMQVERWYPGIEPLADGSVVLIGGAKSGGYVNRNWPDTDPGREGGGAIPSFEFYPSRGKPVDMQLMIDTSGLNMYVHAYLMPSGSMFVQSYLKTIMWDYTENKETALPDMPKGVVRVYPASAAVAMLPLTPKNQYTPTILFCGGSDMPDEAWGNYTAPNYDPWIWPASKDCQRITPEPTDNSKVEYVQDEDMIEGRTMGQFIYLPNGKLLVLNGAVNGTAGYSNVGTPNTKPEDMPYGTGMAAGPTLTPAIYDPEAPLGSRWSNEGLSASEIPRLYHSTAVLLPDGSVFVAGSNPSVDYSPDAYYPTEYRAEYFYPPYWGKLRPEVTGIPPTLTYGGDSFDITISPSSYSGDSNDAAESATVALIRSGFSTHAMNMGQRFMQLENTYTVADDGTITLHVSQLPPNANLVTPGSIIFFVTVNGVPSVGKHVIVGSGKIETQQTLAVAELPPKAPSTSGAKGAGTEPSGDSGAVAARASLGVIVGGAVALFVFLGL
ncbi:glyoxal oxidase [Auricularia subglabra TFB-10046 SS5]|nr:glyoxal oxidase [Auricularia subglabra TFB-10046 SS5]